MIINRMIERNLSRLVYNLNIVPNQANNNSQQRISADNEDHGEQSYQPPNPSYINSSLHTNGFSNTNGTLHADKVASIIQNWNLEFDGLILTNLYIV